MKNIRDLNRIDLIDFSDATEIIIINDRFVNLNKEIFVIKGDSNYPILYYSSVSGYMTDITFYDLKKNMKRFLVYQEGLLESDTYAYLSSDERYEGERIDFTDFLYVTMKEIRKRLKNNLKGKKIISPSSRKANKFFKTISQD